jgi:hypothetical protein
VPTLDPYHIQQKIKKQKNYPQLFRENFQRSYLHLCMRNARYVARRRRQRLNVAGAGNVARMGRDSWASARSARELHTRTVRRAPLAHAAPGSPRTQRAGHWDSSGLDKAFSAQPGQATLLSSHTYTLQG